MLTKYNMKACLRVDLTKKWLNGDLLLLIKESLLVKKEEYGIKNVLRNYKHLLMNLGVKVGMNKLASMMN
jgi:hypothetical protein